MPAREDLLQLIRDNVHHPATARELAQLLKIPREERASFKRQLKALVNDGGLLQLRGNRFGVADKMDVVVGRLTTNPGGFGFVVPEGSEGAKRADRQDVYIAGGNLIEAMHGDRVVARIATDGSQPCIHGRRRMAGTDLGDVAGLPVASRAAGRLQFEMEAGAADTAGVEQASPAQPPRHVLGRAPVG